mmetsp:Transcript_24823/g.30252  ORF Transcript_24823/g.30252 Transcript_24823/m.30252 type:complete len:252 (-) Transcript_24823:62-817(-)
MPKWFCTTQTFQSSSLFIGWDSMNSLSLLDLWSSKGLLNVGQSRIPVHLLEQLIHVALLGHQEGTLAIRHGFEELHGQASRAHLGRQPHPALAIILHLLSLIHSIANTALGHKHGVGHLLLQLGHAHSNVLLANVAWRGSLPQSTVTLESLRSEVTMEELHNELRQHGALWWVAAGTGQQGVVEVLDVCIADVILTTSASLQLQLGWRVSWAWRHEGLQSKASQHEGTNAQNAGHQETVGRADHGETKSTV